MSKQIKRLMDKHPEIFYDVSYEGNDEFGDGTWLYMQPGWYCAASDTGSIHEHSIKEVLECAKHAYQDNERWIAEHASEPDEIANIKAGKYNKVN